MSSLVGHVDAGQRSDTCPQCGCPFLDFEFCPMSGEPHLSKPVCDLCGLSTPFCPRNGQRHSFATDAGIPQQPQPSAGVRQRTRAAAPSNESGSTATTAAQRQQRAVSNEEMRSLQELGFGIFAPGNPAMSRVEKPEEERQLVEDRRVLGDQVRDRLKRGLPVDDLVDQQRAATGMPPSGRSGGAASPGGARHPQSDKNRLGTFFGGDNGSVQSARATDAKRGLFGFSRQDVFKVVFIAALFLLWNARRLGNIFASLFGGERATTV